MRVKVWKDTGEVELNPTWLGEKKYADLPILEAIDTRDFEAARLAYEAAKAALVAQLRPAEPLLPEELEAVKRDEVIA